MYSRKSELEFGNDDEVGDAIRVASLVSDVCCDRSESWLEVEEVVEGDRGVLYWRGAFECIEDSRMWPKRDVLGFTSSGKRWIACDCVDKRPIAVRSVERLMYQGCSGRDAWVAPRRDKIEQIRI
jgi:hypothetical protein